MSASPKSSGPGGWPDEQIFRELAFFKGMPEDLVRQLARLSQILKFATKDTILKQGQLNRNLYFLLAGRVAVMVDGGAVAHLDQRGDLLGEMSVISNAPCAATIQASTEVELLALDADDFQQIAGQHSEHLQNNLYRIYAMILAERVRVTNEKAKHFESLSKDLSAAKEELQSINADLERKVEARTAALQQKTEALLQSHQRLEQQNTALLASHKKIEELYNTRDITFQKLETLYRDSLLPLNQTLIALSKLVPGPVGERVGGASDQVGAVIRLLEPITNRFSAEKAMRSQKVLLADASKKQQVIAKLALGGTGVDLQIASSSEEVTAALDSGGEFDIVFCDSDHLIATPQLRDRWPQTKFVFMTSESIPEYLPRLKSHPFLPNIVSRDDNDRTFTVKNIMTTVAKLASHDIFGLEKYLSWGVDVHESPVRSSTERPALIQAMDDYFAELGLRRTVRERVGTVVEELLMNAIYDAPKGPDGKALYNHVSRKETIDLKPEHYGTIRYGSDGMLLAVSVADPFGGLTGKIILDYLDSCYGGRAGELNREKGGAGRGLHQIIENSDLVVFNVQSRVKTEVIALFNVDPKQSGEKSASFHFFAQ